MRHRDFEVVIECDGQPLEEYTISVDGSAIECFVASEPGKVRFQPRWTELCIILRDRAPYIGFRDCLQQFIATAPHCATHG